MEVMCVVLGVVVILLGSVLLGTIFRADKAEADRDDLGRVIHQIVQKISSKGGEE